MLYRPETPANQVAALTVPEASGCVATWLPRRAVEHDVSCDLMRQRCDAPTLSASFDPHDEQSPSKYLQSGQHSEQQRELASNVNGWPK
ncbi:hypothetical protein AHF37_07037 [Paragonimus kellicotti]|nr:hypothetical protein AHF37_07037 [Paragonimus kellicotti]